MAHCGERKWKKISRNKRFPVCVGTRLMMFVWSVKHLHDMELNYCLSNPETGLILNLLITEIVLLDPSFEQFETYELAITTIGKSPKKNFYWFFCF